MLPLWLQQDMGYTATWAGLVLAPVGMFAIVLMPLVGSVHACDPRMVATGRSCSSASSFWTARAVQHGGRLRHDRPMLLQGVALAVLHLDDAISLSACTPERFPPRQA